MAPVQSKCIKLKSGRKIPIDASNLKAIVNLTTKTRIKRLPVRYVPEPKNKTNQNESDSENDDELQGLLSEAESRRRARSLPEVEPEVEPEIELELVPVPPNPEQQSIFDDDIEDMEPNLVLDDISEAHRGEILLYKGSDSQKRKQYFWKYYPEYARYYDIYDCWNECCLKSKLTFCLKLCPLSPD